MPTTPTSQYYNHQTKELQDTVPDSVRRELHLERIYHRKLKTTNDKLRKENATLKAELRRIRALASKMLQDQPTE